MIDALYPLPIHKRTWVRDKAKPKSNLSAMKNRNLGAICFFAQFLVLMVVVNSAKESLFVAATTASALRGVVTTVTDRRVLEEDYDYDAIDDDDNFEDSSGWNGYVSDDTIQHFEQEAAAGFLSMFELAPKQWSYIQWLYVILILLIFGSCYCCWCMWCVVPRCCGRKGSMMYAAMTN